MVRSKVPSVANDSYYKLGEIDSLDDFVDGLALPHLTSILISEDYECELSDAYSLYWLSEPYGAMEFPISLPCPALEQMPEGDKEESVGSEGNILGASSNSRWHSRLRCVSYTARHMLILKVCKAESRSVTLR